MKDSTLVIPCQYMRQGESFSNAMIGWRSHRSVTADILRGVKDNHIPCFPVRARSGENMAGFIAYHPYMDSGYSFDYHEIIGGVFNKSLKTGKRYSFSFWLYADDSLAYKHLKTVLGKEVKKIYPLQIDSLGIRLSTQEFVSKVHCSKITNQPNYQPQFKISLSQKNVDKGNWKQYRIQFVADSAYRYFAIGNFKADSNTQSSLPLQLSQRIDSLNLGLIKKNGKRIFFEKMKRIAYYAVDDFWCEEEEVSSVILTEEKPYVFQNLEFESGKHIILPESYPELDELFFFLQKKELPVLLEIQGHTDDVGGLDANLLLSQKRADAVANYLINKGLEKENVKTKGMGDSVPLMPNNSESHRAMNRRVEVRIVEK